MPQLIVDGDCIFMGGSTPLLREVIHAKAQWKYEGIEGCLLLQQSETIRQHVTVIARTSMTPDGLPKPWVDGLETAFSCHWPDENSSQVLGRQRISLPLGMPLNFPPDTRQALQSLVESAPAILIANGLSENAASQYVVSDVSLMVTNSFNFI